MRRSKKGITLVELVICCAIIVMLGGACTAVLASGSKIFNDSTASANAQLDTDVLQTYLVSKIPSAKNISKIPEGNKDSVKTEPHGSYLFLNDEGSLTIRIEGKDTTIRSVTGLEYQLKKAGSTDFARAQFCYTATLSDGSKVSGGFILSNIKYPSEGFSGDIGTAPFCFDLPESPT